MIVGPADLGPEKHDRQIFTSVGSADSGPEKHDRHDFHINTVPCYRFSDFTR